MPNEKLAGSMSCRNSRLRRKIVERQRQVTGGASNTPAMKRIRTICTTVVVIAPRTARKS